ncbi:hypothetical protein J4E89_001503 [Alternaria sp. Ai002NY15]|nr:hypothetical protein J4E89_001503 [Alternaria sp. Ai002NY15]
MLAWLTLLIGLSVSLLFGATTATSAQFLSPEQQYNRTAHGLPAAVFTNSVQITLARYSYADYYWDLYLGPYGIKLKIGLPEWNGNDDCNWETKGHGDVGQLICGDWLIYDCERDASWDDGAINCHGWSVHRGYACNF